MNAICSVAIIIIMLTIGCERRPPAGERSYNHITVTDKLRRIAESECRVSGTDQPSTVSQTLIEDLIAGINDTSLLADIAVTCHELAGTGDIKQLRCSCVYTHCFWVIVDRLRTIATCQSRDAIAEIHRRLDATDGLSLRLTNAVNAATPATPCE